MNDLSGDGVAGGAFMTGFTVAPSGNIIYARPGYVENPLNPATYANGSLAQPYPVLAPQATANAINGGNLNSPSNFFNFNPANDLAGIGHFADSAFYAASVLAANGPVIIIALPATPQIDPVTGAITVPTFELQSPTNGSASVPFDTTLDFDPGAILKLQNASLFVQNQGSALQALGTGNNQVVFTSVNDTSVGTGTGATGTAPARRRLGRHRLPQLRRSPPTARSSRSTAPSRGRTARPPSRGPATSSRSSTSPTSATPAAPSPPPMALATTRSPSTTAARR